MKKIHLIGPYLFMVFVLGGCAGSTNIQEEGGREGEPLGLAKSYLLASSVAPTDEGDLDSVGGPEISPDVYGVALGRAGIGDLETLGWKARQSSEAVLARDFFSDDKKLSVSAEKMLLSDFIHYTFGDLLGVNYVLGTAIESLDEERVTLSVTEKLGAKELFDLVARLLDQRGVGILRASKSFFVFKREGSSDEPRVIMSIGRELTSVPKNAAKIMQVVPLKFGVKVSIERLLRELTKAKITADYGQSVIFLEGSREEILHSIELIDMLDTPAMRGRFISMVRLNFLSPQAFSGDLKQLLINEGVDIAIGDPNNKNLVLVPLSQLGAVVVFATDEFLVERVKYWASVIDVEAEGPGKQYYIYHPKYARSVDLDKSISQLLGLGRDNGSAGQPLGGSTGNAPSGNRMAPSGDNDLNMVIDERANALIFHSTGDAYRALLPLLCQSK